MRLLALDIGERRTGCAVTDTETGFVSPLDVLTHGNETELMRLAARVIDEHGPDRLVVGLPINMDGTEGPMAKRVRELAERIADANRVTVEFQDERLTSFEADQRMARSGRTHGQKKRLRDALAATAILEDWLRARADGTSEPADGDAE